MESANDVCEGVFYWVNLPLLRDPVRTATNTPLVEATVVLNIH